MVLMHSKQQLDSFLHQFPSIETQHSLDKLKPIARTNMYSTLFVLPILALGAITAYTTITQGDLYTTLVVCALSVGVSILFQSYASSEKNIKHIACANEKLESELNQILQCWMTKALPNF